MRLSVTRNVIRPPMMSADEWIAKVKHVLTYRLQRRLLTFPNCFALGMIQHALPFLSTPAQGTAAYFAVLHIDPRAIAVWMLLSALVMVGRRLPAIGVFVCGLPVVAYALTVVYVTNTVPGYPPTPVTGWILLLLLIYGYVFERANDPR